MGLCEDQNFAWNLNGRNTFRLNSGHSLAERVIDTRFDRFKRFMSGARVDDRLRPLTSQYNTIAYMK